MLVRFAELLAFAAQRESAVGGFSAYNLETAVAVLEASACRDAGVILMISERAFAARAGRALTRMLVSVAAQADVPCCVQLDHVTALSTMEQAFEAGIGAVMADGSKLPFDENVELVAAAVRLAEGFGGGVEAELGRIEGDEEIADAAADGQLTDPGEAEEYLVRTGAHCLAVSIGNAHGRYVRPPELDLKRLERIHAATGTPLSLHGASGLPDAMVVGAVARGIRKVNVNTELRDRYFDVVAERLGELRAGAHLLALQEDTVSALTEVVDSKLTVFAAGAENRTAGCQGGVT